jgi:uncharacterized protein
VKKSGIKFCLVLFFMIFVVAIGGCLSISNSPESRFYMLSALEKGPSAKTCEIPQDVVIAIGPVKIPEYQDRPQIVTQNKDNMLKFAEFDRWGEPLGTALERIIFEDLVVMLPAATLKMFPCSSAIPVKYQVIVNVTQLQSQLDKDMLLMVDWSIIDAKNSSMLLSRKSQFRQAINPHNYSGLTKALSATCASLSGEIAEALEGVTKQPKRIEIPPAPARSGA